MITITKRSMFSGNINTMDLPITWEEYNEAYAQYAQGALIQNCFSMLNDDQREFLISGMIPKEWEAATYDDEDFYEDYMDEAAF